MARTLGRQHPVTSRGLPAADNGAAAEFERLYRANVDAMTAYFARRSADPQVVADLTADTFVAVITGFGSFDPRKGGARAWVFGIARRGCSTGSTPNEPAGTWQAVWPR